MQHTFESNLLLAKKTQLAREDICPTGEGEAAGESKPKAIKDPVSPAYDSHTESVYAVVSEWLESIDSSTPSESNDLISTQLTSSALNMSNREDANAFAMSPAPASAVSGASVGNAASESSSRSVASSKSAKRLVQDRSYRSLNLVSHNIRLRQPHEEIPEYIARLINEIRQDRVSPEPSLDSIRQDSALTKLEWAASSESEVEKYFSTKVFPDPDPNESLQRTDRHPMAPHTIPKVATSDYKLATPVPDILYGYNRDMAFPQHTVHLLATETESIANSQDLIYPFFDIEFKGEDGSLWEGTNQCLAGSASCVNMVEALNDRLDERKNNKVQSINSAAFSVTMSGTEARLFVTWKENNKYSMSKVESFLLQSPDHYLKFRKLLRNILDWGRNRRLSEIKGVLDVVFEGDGGGSGASERVKSREPPFDSSSLVKGKRLRVRE
ncbi:hypothetical protein EMCG_04943 [[Emmonsia] crescens]|uniref:DUF7924 domain-containing protein n=1 Tax=[Emmonsia] crescens TaxID=73230 RepID=A0A0G2HRJ4_9EURO|nr:hypothetical protein EMCG_04943 [Emmonsia crescens UAMH 3008]